jgi:hypothetical protein
MNPNVSVKLGELSRRKDRDKAGLRKATVFRRKLDEAKQSMANMRRRAKEFKAFMDGSADLFPLVLTCWTIYFNNVCVIGGKSGQIIEPDHWEPLARGGEHTLGNLLPVSQSANRKKNDRFIEEVPHLLTTGWKLRVWRANEFKDKIRTLWLSEQPTNIRDFGMDVFLSNQL